jgi:hypothetical protein
VSTSVTNVQNVNVASQTGVSIDTTKWTGVTNLTITANANSLSSSVNSSVTAAPTTNINFNDINSSNSSSIVDNITGGQNVTINESNVAGGSVTVSGLNGTQSVSVTQTLSGSTSTYANVSITDYNSIASTPSLGTITTVSLYGVSGNNTITDNNLQNLTIDNATSNPTITITDNSAVSGVPAALTLNLSNDANTKITESDNSGKGQYTTLNVVTGAKNSDITFTGFKALSTLNVSGNSVLTLDSQPSTVLSTVTISQAAGFTATVNTSGTTTTTVLPNTLTSITDSSSGVVNIVMPTNATTNNTTTANFYGSAASGQQIISITQPLAATASILGGTATNNELIINANGNYPTNTTSGAINSFGAGTVSGFDVLGIVTLSTTNTTNFDIAALGAQLGSFNNTIDLISMSGTSTLYNIANNSTLQFDGNGAYSNSTITAQFAGTSGATDTANVVFNHNATDSSPIIISSLTLQDSASNGIGTLNITDTTSASSLGSAADTINLLTDNFTTLNITSNNSFAITELINYTSSPVSINLSGAGLFTFVSATLNTPTLTINDNSTNATASTFNNITDSSLTTLNLAGTHTAGIAASLSDTTTSPVSINLSGAGLFNLTLGSVTSSFTTPTLTITDNSTNTAPSTFTITDSSLTTLNLAGTHSIDLSSASALGSSSALNITTTNTAGVNIGSSSGSLDISTNVGSTNNFFNFNTGNNSLYLTTTPASDQTNNFTFGNGTNMLNLSSDGSSANVTNNIIVGNGSNTIVLNDSGTVSNNVTLGSANQDINHYTTISDNGTNNLVLSFSNTINPDNSSASAIASIAVASTSTFLADLNQAIAQTSTASPFAYFTINDSLVPGTPGHGSTTDTVIVDHSLANSSNVFVPGQDAFVVLIGTPTISSSDVSAGHITIA